MAKIIIIFLSVLTAFITPSLAAMSKNQLRLIKFSSQFEGFENRFSLNEFVSDQSMRIVHDWGSGNYCIYELERNYNYIPSEKVKNEMSRFLFDSVSPQADVAEAKVNISQNGSTLRVYVEDGPYDNFFDPRCG